MNIFEKVLNCIANKMVKNKVPTKVAFKHASVYVAGMTTADLSDINNGDLTLEYSNLNINKVKKHSKHTKHTVTLTLAEKV